MKISILLMTSILFLGCSESNITQTEVAQTEVAQAKAIKKVEVQKKEPSVNIKTNQTISSPVSIEFKSNSVWFANEGELGTLTLVDSDKQKLGVAILRVTDGNWMSKESVTSKITLNFKTKNSTRAKLIFKNNNPSKTEGTNKILEIDVLLEKSTPPNILVGDWYQIEPKRATKAFTLREDGTAKSLTMATLLYKSYKRVGDDKISFSIESIGNGSSSTDDYLYYIQSLNDDKMILQEIYKGKKSKTKEVYTKSHKYK